MRDLCMCKDRDLLEANTRAVYTVLFGDYEELNELRITREPDIDYICFTDNRELRSETWNIHLTTPEFPLDSVRSQRLIKISGHEHLSRYSETLYIDNSVIIKQPASAFFEMLLAESDIGMPRHSFRETVLEEFQEVSRLEFDSPLRLEEQLQHYKSTYPETLEMQPLWTAIIARRNSSSTESFERTCANHVLRYSRRDQLSLRVAQLISKVDIFEKEINNTGSVMHEWPVVQGRSSEVPSFEIKSVNSDVNLLESRLTELRKEHTQLEISFEISQLDRLYAENELHKILNTLSWRITSPLRFIKHKINIFNSRKPE